MSQSGKESEGGGGKTMWRKMDWEGESCQNQQAFGKTCFSCWIRVFSSFQHSLWLLLHFFGFHWSLFGGQFRVTNHPVWEKNQPKHKTSHCCQVNQTFLFKHAWLWQSQAVLTCNKERSILRRNFNILRNTLTFFYADRKMRGSIPLSCLNLLLGFSIRPRGSLALSTV